MNAAHKFVRTDRTGKRLAFFNFFVTFSVERGVFVFFLMENGYNSIQIGLLQVVFSTALFIFELPSGVFADKFGRSLSLTAGGALAAVSLYGQFLFVSSSFFLTIFFILHSLSFSLISGSLSTALYQQLKCTGNITAYAKNYATIQFMGSTALGLAMISAAPLLSLGGWKAIYITSSAMAIFSLVFIFPLVKKERTTGTAKKALPNFKDFRAELLAVTPLALPFAMMHAAMTPYFLYASSLFKNSGMNHGTASASVGLVEIISACATLLIIRRAVGSHTKIIPLLMILVSILIAGNSLYSPIAAILAFLICNTLVLWATIMMNELINATIASEHLRTTTLSAVAFLDMIFISAGFMTYGLVAEFATVGSASFAIALFPLLGAALLKSAITSRNNRRHHAPTEL